MKERTTCYSSKESRLKELRGRFTIKSNEVASRNEVSYWNLSCPFEWVKYSCAHQGGSHADLAKRVEYEASECDLPAFDASSLSRALDGGKRLVFLGDSLVRQISISMSCMLHHAALIKRFDVGWPKCSVGSWPCHDTVNCRKCGEHSGFNEMSIYLNDTISGASRRTGGIIHTLSGKGFHFFGFNPRHEFTFREDDILVVETVRIDDFAIVQKNLNTYFGSQAALPRFIWLMGWPSFFNTQGGHYNESRLSELETNSSSKSHCRSTVPKNSLNEDLAKRVKEWKIHSDGSGVPVSISTGRTSRLGFNEGPFRDRHRVRLSRTASKSRNTTQLEKDIDGILWLQGEESIGDYTVGSGVGAHGDCLHLCQPGPPDEIARALSWMIIGIVEESHVKRRADKVDRHSAARHLLSSNSDASSDDSIIFISSLVFPLTCILFIFVTVIARGGPRKFNNGIAYFT